MILDIIAILFIIGLSFILCMKDNNYTCQLSHIVIGLSVIVFYKLAKVLKLNNATTKSTEGFDGTTSSLNDFISGNIVGDVVMTPNQAQTLSTNDLVAYNQRLESLINAINDLRNQQANPAPNVAASPDNIQKLNLESQQQYQMFQIDYLNKQLQNAKDILNSQTIANNSTNYKPIKVYSSCVISNADGSTSIENPIATTSMTHNTNLLQSNSVIGSNITTSSSNTGNILPGTGSIGSTTPNSGSSKFVNLAPNTGVFNDFLNKLSNGAGNININL